MKSLNDFTVSFEAVIPVVPVAFWITTARLTIIRFCLSTTSSASSQILDTE